MAVLAHFTPKYSNELVKNSSIKSAYSLFRSEKVYQMVVTYVHFIASFIKKVKSLGNSFVPLLPSHNMKTNGKSNAM